MGRWDATFHSGNLMNKLLLIVVGLIAFGGGTLAAADDEHPLSLVVMDPLAAPLSCPCVEGYAQRKYEALAEHLEQALEQPVKLTFAESLSLALKKAGGRADLIIGKQSVVQADAKAAQVPVTALAQLTDKQGATTQHGLIVVNRDDPAKSIEQLQGYTIIFGPSEAAEKHSAAMSLLVGAGVHVPKDRQRIDAACSDGACKVIDLGPQSNTAAVISSYAQPLLEGCGTIKKGDLRVVGQTAAVPFITAFATDGLTAEQRTAVAAALGNLADKPDVLQALESLVGFLPVEAASPAVKKK